MRGLFKELSRSVWFLDYDGTLCPHQEVWDGFDYNPREIAAAVKHLAQRVHQVYWNTGRRVESLGGVNPEFMDYSGYFIQGSLKWDAEKKKIETLGKEFPATLGTELKNTFKNMPQFRVEIKMTGARVASMHKPQIKTMQKFINTLPLRLPDSWEWRVGQRGAELLQKNFSKGSALVDYFKHSKEKNLIPVVAGDDAFDRSAMEYALAHDGYAVLIGEGCGWITEIPHRASQVVYLREPRDLLQFLRGL